MKKIKNKQKYALLKDGIVISVSNHASNKELFENGIEEIAVDIDSAHDLLGLSKSDLSSKRKMNSAISKNKKNVEELSKPDPKIAMKSLFNEINFEKSIGNDISKLQERYDKMVEEYKKAKH